MRSPIRTLFAVGLALAACTAPLSAYEFGYQVCDGKQPSKATWAQQKVISGHPPKMLNADMNVREGYILDQAGHVLALYPQDGEVKGDVFQGSRYICDAGEIQGVVQSMLGPSNVAQSSSWVVDGLAKAWSALKF